MIQKQDNKPLDMNAAMQIPARFVPSFRVVFANENGARNNLLLRLHGGLGDVVCAEPSIRYALNHFKGLNMSLASIYAPLFQHLKFDKVFTQDNVGELDIKKFLMYENVDTSNELAAEFVCHTIMHGIDYASLYMWRTILPRAEREIVLVPNADEISYACATIDPTTDVIIHPGKTWPSRTMPKKWWNSIITTILKRGYRPVIIGGTVDQGRASTVDVDVPSGALDLRYKSSLMETVAMLQYARVLLTNDSAPLHMATTGNAWIGFLSTVKHPDHLLTYRKGQWAWRMQDLALGGVYQTLDFCPNKDRTIRVDDVDIRDLLSWLPEPTRVADWAIDKLKELYTV